MTAALARIKDFLMNPRFLLTDGHFYAASCLLVIALLVFNHYWIFPDAATLLQKTEFVEKVAGYYPALRNIKSQWGGYTLEVGMTFALMACGMPVHLLLGIASTWFFPSERRQKFVMNSSWVRLILLFGIVVGVSSVAHFIPDVNGTEWRGQSIDQASKTPIFLVYSWILISTMVFFSGQFLGVFFHKLCISLNRRTDGPIER